MQFSKTHYLDFHTHRLRFVQEPDVTEIVSLELGDEREHQLYTISKHPWIAKEPITATEKEQILAHLTQKNCLALGEIGLDKLKGEPMAQQVEILRSLLNIAQETNVPVIIHCVRAFHQLLEIKKEYPTIKKWCVHGFSRHWELAQQLLAQDFYLSIMPRTHLNNSYIELMKNLPADRFFLETDSLPDIHIKEIYLQVSEIRQISVNELKEQMSNNAIQFFAT